MTEFKVGDVVTLTNTHKDWNKSIYSVRYGVNYTITDIRDKDEDEGDIYDDCGTTTSYIGLVDSEGNIATGWFATRFNLVTPIESPELTELRKWKEDAIKRYPDLDVDPLVLKAREICGRYTSYHIDYTGGKFDQSFVMKCVIDALKEGQANAV